VNRTGKTREKRVPSDKMSGVSGGAVFSILLVWLRINRLAPSVLISMGLPKKVRVLAKTGHRIIQPETGREKGGGWGGFRLWWPDRLSR